MNKLWNRFISIIQRDWRGCSAFMPIL